MLPRHGFLAKSLQLPCQHKSQKIFARPDAYAERVFKFVRKVEAGDFNGNISALELALVYRRWSLVILHFRVIIAVALELHRIRDQLVCPT